MKISKTTLLFIVPVFLLGFATGSTGWHKTITVHAQSQSQSQSTSPSYLCTFGPQGINAASPCTQYIVNVATQRLGGGVFVYQVQSNPVDVASLDEVTAVAGPIRATSVQEPLPNNAGGTFTIAITEP